MSRRQPIRRPSHYNRFTLETEPVSTALAARDAQYRAALGLTARGGYPSELGNAVGHGHGHGVSLHITGL